MYKTHAANFLGQKDAIPRNFFKYSLYPGQFQLNYWIYFSLKANVIYNIVTYTQDASNDR
jgi:hypothetical protein